MNSLFLASFLLVSSAVSAQSQGVLQKLDSKLTETLNPKAEQPRANVKHDFDSMKLLEEERKRLHLGKVSVGKQQGTMAPFFNQDPKPKKEWDERYERLRTMGTYGKDLPRYYELKFHRQSLSEAESTEMKAIEHRAVVKKERMDKVYEEMAAKAEFDGCSFSNDRTLISCPAGHVYKLDAGLSSFQERKNTKADLKDGSRGSKPKQSPASKNE